MGQDDLNLHIQLAHDDDELAGEYTVHIISKKFHSIKLSFKTYSSTKWNILDLVTDLELSTKTRKTLRGNLF